MFDLYACLIAFIVNESSHIGWGIDVKTKFGLNVLSVAQCTIQRSGIFLYATLQFDFAQKKYDNTVH